MKDELNEQEGGEIKLPPLPNEAIEYDPLSLEAMVDDNDHEPEFNAQEAEFDALNSEVEENDDKLSSALKDLVSGSSSDPISEMINDEPVITEDPMPTPVAPEKEFDPTSTQNALDDFDEEGGVRKAVIRGPTLTKSASKEVRINLGSRTSDYSPGTVQDALQDSNVEGGVVSNKSTGAMKTPGGDSARDGAQVKGNTDESDVTKYRVYGFNIQYQTINQDERVTVTRQVNDFFEDQNKAMMSVNGSKYLMLLNNGIEVVDIVSGTPQISYGDQNLYTYNGEKKLGEGGYWKRS
jgi:hypothetical protein